MNFVAALIGDGKRGSELPALGKFQAGGVIDVIGFEAFGIEQNLIPADHCHFVGGGRACGKSAFKGGGGKEIKFSFDFIDGGRNFDVEGVSVEQVAAPFQSFARGVELKAG